MKQQALFQTVNGKVVVHNNFAGNPDQSKDEILRARFDATCAETIRAFCRGRRITVTQFLRSYARLGADYFDHVKTLTDPEVKKIVLPMLEILTKNT